MFKNLTIYRSNISFATSQAKIEEALQAKRFVPCGASQEVSIGWIPPRGDEHGLLMETINGHGILKLCIETKKVPADVVKRKVEEQCAIIEQQTGRKPGKKERREISDDARMSLLPMAFTSIATVTVWIDAGTGIIGIDSSSQARVDAVTTELVQAVDGIAMQMLNTQVSPAAAMALWLSTKEAPPDFSVDRECELKASDESKAVVKYGRHALDTDEVVQHIALGKMPTKLAMTWNDRVSFVLTDALKLKKIAILDVVFEESSRAAGDGKHDNFDADVAITTGELSALIPKLISALGGEIEPPKGTP